MTAEARPVSGTIEVGGQRLHYLDWGNEGATPLVLLHGLAGTAAEWQRIAEHFRDRYHVVALDQRGHGDSARAHDGAYDTDSYVRDLEGFIDALAFERVVLCGHSMGGHHTMAYVARHPDRVLCALVNDMPPAFTRQGRPEAPRVYASLDDWLAEQREANPLTPEPLLRLRGETRLRPADGGLALKADPAAIRDWAPRDLWDEARSIQRPVFFIRGGRSQVLDAQTLMDMDMAIEPARSITLEQAGHTTFFDMEPEWLAAADQFFAAHASAPAAASRGA